MLVIAIAFCLVIGLAVVLATGRGSRAQQWECEKNNLIHN